MQVTPTTSLIMGYELLGLIDAPTLALQVGRQHLSVRLAVEVGDYYLLYFCFETGYPMVFVPEHTIRCNTHS